MWCPHCQQDVPALPSGDDQQPLCCARCGGAALRPDTPETVASAQAYDDWELDEQLRHIGRVLRTTASKDNAGKAADRREASRFDLPHTDAAAWHVPAGESPKQPKTRTKTNTKTRKTERGSVLGALTWTALSLGMASFLCGGILLGWSLATDRQELWSVGLPVALGGQIALLVGLVLQIDRLWYDNRTAAAKLDSVDEQLHELKAVTTLLGASQGPAAGVFYSHFAGGAGPQLLLTDLKSQLDLLAMKIAQEER